MLPALHTRSAYAAVAATLLLAASTTAVLVVQRAADQVVDGFRHACTDRTPGTTA